MNEGRPLAALVVSYAFPPVGGAGVQRVAKLVKYLPEHGVLPTVLTAKNPSVPLHDESQARELPEGLEVLRVPTFEPGYRTKRAAWKATANGNGASVQGGEGVKRWLLSQLVALGKSMLIPDPQVLWQPSAQLALARRLAANPPDVVFISGPPFSQFLLTPLAKLSRGTAVVLDYRDEWSTYRSTYEMMSPVADRVGRLIEQRLLERADAVTTATEAFRAELLSRFRFLDPARVVAIPNGYDPSDFAGELPTPPSDRLVLTYAGTVFRLTSARGLLGAIRRLAAREPDLESRLEVRFIGRIVDTEADAFAGTEQLGVVRLGYVDHHRVISHLAQSHVVLCLLDDVPGAERIYPAKIFELMYLGRPCLVLAPDGALAELVRRHRLGRVVHPRDEAAIAAELGRLLREQREGRLPFEAERVGIERYHRRALAGQFARVFRAVSRRPDRPSPVPAGDSLHV